jgi:hypothetical protein
VRKLKKIKKRPKGAHQKKEKKREEKREGAMLLSFSTHVLLSSSMFFI